MSDSHHRCGSMTAYFRTALLLTAAVLPQQLWAQDAPLPAPTPPSSPPPTAPPVPGSGRTQLDAGLEVTGVHDDNIFVTRNHEADDFLLIARPTLSLTTTWGENLLTLRGQGEVGRYADFTSENYSDWLAGIDARLRAGSSLTIVGGGEYQWEHENRESPEDVEGIEPTNYERAFAYGGLLYGADRVSARLAGTLTRFDYRDVASTLGIINNDDRDRDQFDVGGRLAYRVGRSWNLFVQGSYDERNYDQPVDDAGLARDSSGFGVVAGFRNQFSPRLSAELFAGYLHQDYGDSRLADVGSWDLGALIEWTGPAGLGTTIRFDRSIEETTFPGASAYVLTSGSVALRLSPHPRIQAGGGITGYHYDYQGVPRSEFITGAQLWARYWLSRHLYLGLDYNLSQRTSNAAGFDFDQNRLMLRLGAQLRPRYASDISPLLFSRTAPAGAYAGLLLGHGTLVTALDGPRGQGSNTADFGDMGFGYGVVLGYGILTGPLYVGVEAEAFLDGPAWLHVAERRFSVARKDSFGLAARLGYATAARDLVYGRFGVTSTNLRTDYRRLEEQLLLASDRRRGLGLGFGLEAGAGRRAFVRAEYVVTSYGDHDVPTVRDEFDNFSTSEGQFRVGGGIRFGAPRAEQPELPATLFEGLYAGVQLGHGALVSRNLGVREQSEAIDIQRASLGPVLGAFAGYGFVWRRFYVGAEIEGDISNIDWNIERDPNGRIYSAEHEHSYGGGFRVGWVIGNSALAYGRIGAVRTHFDIPFATSNVSVLSEETRSGLRWGAGLEIGLSGRARLRLDYAVTDYDRYDVLYGNNRDRFEHEESLARIGFVWRLQP